MASLLGGGRKNRGAGARRPGASSSGGRVQVPGAGYYATMPQILFHGPLMKMKSKRGMGIGSRWNKRYFTVEAIGDAGEYAMCYFYNKHDALRLDLPSREPGAWFYLSSISRVGRSRNIKNVAKKSKFPHGFVINTRKRDLYLRAETKEQYAMWVAGLCSTCGIAPPVDAKWPGGELGPIPPLLVKRDSSLTGDGLGGGEVAVAAAASVTTLSAAGRGSASSPSQASAGHKSESSSTNSLRSGMISDLRDWTIKSEDEVKREHASASPLRKWEIDESQADPAPGGENDFNFPKSAIKKKQKNNSSENNSHRRQRGDDDGSISSRSEGKMHTPEASRRESKSPSSDLDRSGRSDARSPASPSELRRGGDEVLEGSFEDTASSSSDNDDNGARGGVNGNDGSDDSDGLGLGDDDLDEWVGTPKKPVATGTKLELQSHSDFYENNWRTQTKLKKLNEKRAVPKGSPGLVHGTVETLTDSEGTDDTESSGDEGRGRAVKIGRRMLPRLDSFDDMEDDGLIDDVEGLIGGHPAGRASDAGEKIQSSIENAMKARMRGESGQASSFSSKNGDDGDDSVSFGRPGGASSKTEDHDALAKVEKKKSKKAKKKAKKAKKAKKSKKNRPAPPGAPRPPGSPTGESANLVAMDPNFLNDEFDSDSDSGAKIDDQGRSGGRGESKQSVVDGGEGKSVSSPAVAGPSANLVREDSNWLDDNFDEEEDEDDEKEGKVATSSRVSSPRSKKAGVAVDTNFASSDWDESHGAEFFSPKGGSTS